MPPNLLSLSSFFLISLLCGFSHVQATAQPGVFEKYPNKYFIETGSYKGDGILMAFQCGFEEIISIELSNYYVQYCQNRFINQSNVTILEGDSGKVLPELLANIEEPITFWLDGHYSGVLYGARSDTLTPILAELESIKHHAIKTHTILIDDVRLFGTTHFDYITLEKILQKIKEINPEYLITYEDGVVPDDILVAYLP